MMNEDIQISDEFFLFSSSQLFFLFIIVPFHEKAVIEIYGIKCNVYIFSLFKICCCAHKCPRQLWPISRSTFHWVRKGVQSTSIIYGELKCNMDMQGSHHGFEPCAREAREKCPQIRKIFCYVFWIFSRFPRNDLYKEAIWKKPAQPPLTTCTHVVVLHAFNIYILF